MHGLLKDHSVSILTSVERCSNVTFKAIKWFFRIRYSRQFWRIFPPKNLQSYLMDEILHHLRGITLLNHGKLHG